MKLFVDFETYYDTKIGYTLASNRKDRVSMTEYVKDSRFFVHGVGVSEDYAKPFWVTGNDCKKYFSGLKTEAIDLVAQNIKFDGSILSWFYGFSFKSYIDTLSMSRAVLSTKVGSHSLRSISEYYGLPPKGEMHTDGLRTLTAEQEKELEIYCLHDVELCKEIEIRLSKDFPVKKYPVMDLFMRCYIEPKLTLDRSLLGAVHEQEKKRRENIFVSLGIDKKVFSSNEKFSELLKAEGYEVPTKMSPKQGKMIPALALGDEGFQALLETEDPRLQDLCEARIAAKSTLMETRSSKLLKISEYNMFPFDIRFSGAQQTHRASGDNGAGGNPQNFPRGSDLRKAVCVPKGHKLLVADFAAIEARIVAWLAREQKLVDVFSLDGDPYCSFSSKIYGREITKADKIERMFGKMCILGLGYGMGWEKFQKSAKRNSIELSDEESQRVVNLYRSYYSSISGLWDYLDGLIPHIAAGVNMAVPFAPFLRVQNRSIIGPTGLRINYPGLKLNRDGRKTNWNYYPRPRVGKDTAPVKLYGAKLLENISQHLAGEFCTNAMLRAKALGLEVVGQVHDEILVRAPEDEAKIQAELLRQAMESPVPWWPSIKLRAEVGIGNNWLEAK